MLGGETSDSDWRLVIRRLRRLETPSQRIRDWLRFFLRERAFFREAGGVIPLLKSSLHTGSFANTIYACGCLLEFFWNEIALEKPPGPQITQTVGGFFGIDTESAQERCVVLARRAEAAWDLHLRYAPL
jgi:hypothetical protein